MTAADKKFLFDLLNTPSPTGFEFRGQRKWLREVKKCADSVESDAYGNAWAVLEGTASKPQTIMIEAHADEIGFIVKHITSEGFLHIDRIGGSDHATARGRRLTIFGDKGEVRGLIGNTAIHLRKDDLGNEKAPRIHELYIDIGASDADEVAKRGIRVGHPAVYSDSAEMLDDTHIVGRALDNRIGGFIIAQVLKRLAKKRTPNTVIAVNAVQEEIGGLGAKMATYRLQPDLAIVLDVTHATDTPGIDNTIHGKIELGGGPSVTHGTCNHPNVVERLIEVARKGKIPLQHESSSRYSGTDTDKIYHVREGIPSALISLPLRYMHSIIEMADLNDVNKVIDLYVAFLHSVTARESFAVKL